MTFIGHKREGLKMFKLYGAHILCLLLLLQQVDCQANDKVQIDGPLENKDFFVKEGSQGGMMLYRFIFQPPVVSLRLTGDTDGIIEIVSDGVLYLNKALDWETKKVHKLQLEGLNASGQKVQGPYFINIYVEDINDNPPTFEKNNYTGTVRQNSRPGKPFMYIKAIDLDDPNTLNGQLSYRLRNHFPNPFQEMLFQVDNVTGAISTTKAGHQYLDPAQEREYVLDVEVYDMAGQSINAFSASTDVRVTVLENLWKSPGLVKIKENSTEPHPISIAQVQWNYPGAYYEISSKETPSVKLPFMVDNNGTIYVTEPLDREKKESYSFYVYAKEEGISLSYPVTVNVTVEDINDNPPVCNKALTKFEVQENEVAGNYIGTFQASDADKEGTINSRLHYDIVYQNPKIPVDKLFRIDFGTGNINILQSALNRQEASNYSLKVEVTDQVFKTVCDVLINVIDINDQIPIFEKSDYGDVTLPEDRRVGTVILEIQATDGDEPFTGSSQIIYTVTNGDPNNTFSIRTDPKTNRGYVTINKVLDFETTPMYYLDIGATNPEPLVLGTQYNSSSFTKLRVAVTDVDEVPVFLQKTYTVEMLENVTFGTFVMTARAYDPEGAQIKYSLKNNNRNWLRIDPLSGSIYTAALMDRETESPYVVQIVATEQTRASKSSMAQLTLNLKDVNDNPPQLEKDSVFFCHPLQGNQKAKIDVHDPDIYSYIPKFSYVLLGDNTVQNNWNVSKDGLHAYISPKNINLEEKDYDIPIKINDNGRPPMEGVVYLKVKVCRCVEGRCFIPTDPSPFPTVATAIGILVAVLIVIGVILGIVFLRLKRKSQSQQISTKANPASRPNCRA
ncbi:cadherin-17 isoform X1 [Anolis carolinensis]|uniref:cadherin-17 isoform X1 n=2 Tax=Anolis carolinensis TaxID=28377 RepID=UPI002F2B407F